VRHRPHRLHHAELAELAEIMISSADLPAPIEPSHVLFSLGVEVDIYPLRPVS
jgi:hypothetical protein